MLFLILSYVYIFTYYSICITLRQVFIGSSVHIMRYMYTKVEVSAKLRQAILSKLYDLKF